jgi:hypothetical protein
MKPPVGANAEVPANVTAQSKQTPAGTNASAEVIDAVQDAVVTPVRSDNASTTTATKDDDGGIDVVVEPRGGMSDAPEAVRYSDEMTRTTTSRCSSSSSRPSSSSSSRLSSSGLP